jgi:CRISPR-associated protein Csm3
MNKKVFQIDLEILTGLHIGSGNDSVQIGGVDSAVIKDPILQIPYIPGSSLKGKIRCLLETEAGYGERNDLLNCFFGATSDFIKSKKNDPDFKETPTRLIFRDMKLTPEDKERFLSGEINTETKTEIKIDRQKGKAQDGGLRSIERVPASIRFKSELLVRYKDEEELKKIEEMVRQGIVLLNNDYLGGSGSRGYGAVNLKIS